MIKYRSLPNSEIEGGLWDIPHSTCNRLLTGLVKDKELDTTKSTGLLPRDRYQIDVELINWRESEQLIKIQLINFTFVRFGSYLLLKDLVLITFF